MAAFGMWLKVKQFDQVGGGQRRDCNCVLQGVLRGCVFEYRWQCVQNRFLRSRISANTSQAGFPTSPTCFATSGISARRKGFAAFSSPSKEGIVIVLAA